MTQSTSLEDHSEDCYVVNAFWWGQVKAKRPGRRTVTPRQQMLAWSPVVEMKGTWQNMVSSNVTETKPTRLTDRREEKGEKTQMKTLVLKSTGGKQGRGEDLSGEVLLHRGAEIRGSNGTGVWSQWRGFYSPG